MAKKLNNLRSVLAAKDKDKDVKEAKEGHDFGKKGKNFKKVEEKAEKEYGSKKAGEKVAGAAFWKQREKEDK